MNFKQFYLTEMPQMTSFDSKHEHIVRLCKQYEQQSSFTDDTDSYKHYDFYLNKFKSHHGMVMLIECNREKEYIGYIKFNPFYKIDKSIQIQMTEISEDHQGLGIATAAYEYLLTKFDAIVSDEEITDGTEALYEKLGKKYKKMIYTIREGLEDIDFTADEFKKKNYNDKKIFLVLKNKN